MKKMLYVLGAIALIVLVVVGLWFFIRMRSDSAAQQLETKLSNSTPSTIELTSTAFANSEAISVEYTCDGEDISPPLQWGNLPAETASVVLLLTDPDAPGGTFTHWIVSHIPPDVTQLPANQSKLAAKEVKQGQNDFGNIGYSGPCPPDGQHRYFFRVYALDTPLDLEEGASRVDVLNAMENHVLTTGELMGTYGAP